MAIFKDEKVYWLEGAIPGKAYKESIFYRCPGIGHFIKKVGEDREIVGMIFVGNRIEFILDKK